MKHLLILRHGKSDWNKPGQDDRERALTARGQRAAVRVASWIDDNGLRPSVALVSSARRTRETWQMAQSVWDATVDARVSEALYLASPDDVLAQLAALDDGCARALVIGHNPGLEALCGELAGAGSLPGALEGLQRGFVTAALAVFELDGASWSDLAGDGSRLVRFVRPEDLD